jgi:hypothetical protein
VGDTPRILTRRRPAPDAGRCESAGHPRRVRIIGREMRTMPADEQVIAEETDRLVDE